MNENPTNTTAPSDAAIAIVPASTAQASAARNLGLRWKLPVAEQPNANYYLSLTNEQLELRCQAEPKSGAVIVDWLGGSAGHRRRFGGGKGQTIARAVGLKSGVAPSVVDATAGLGRDAFVLACLGCKVKLVERAPAVAALLNDGYDRACHDDEIGQQVKDNMMLIHADAVDYLTTLESDERPDVVYLDPMYPKRSKSSLVKKEMRALQNILGDDANANRLLPAALTAARNRVVVKRPLAADHLNEHIPTMAIKGKKHRYDVYVIKAMSL